jgi:hydroxyacylglutathione hydrolase
MKNTMANITRGLLVLTVVVCSILAAQPAPGLSPAAADSLIKADTTVVLLDVRTKGEFEGELGHLKSAVLIPIDTLEHRLGDLPGDRTILVYCRSGRRSAIGTQLLRSKGYRAFNLEGGILRWNQEHLPVVKERTE